MKQVIEKVAEGWRPVKRLGFNLSQFAVHLDLLGAFQLIRNGTLSGKVPLVLFDEYDARLGSKLGWLRYFLALMQDDEFLDHGRMHPLGQANFAFIGGTSSTFERFTEGALILPLLTLNGRILLPPKGSDFVSRLRGYVNVRGPDLVS